MNKNYIVWLKSDKKSDNTIKNYVKYINNFLTFVNKDDIDITVEDFLRYKDTISNLSSASIALQINAIKSYFRFLEEMEIIAKNPIAKAKTPKIKNKVKPYIKAEDISALLKAARTNRDKAIILTTASTGMRFCELSSITTEQWNEMKYYGQNTITIIGKGDKERTICFNDCVIEAIDNYLSSKTVTSGYVFESFEGNPINIANLDSTLKVIARKANLPYCEDISMHYLRVAFATISNTNGVDIATISAALGHSSIAVTSRYIKTQQENINNAMCAIRF